MENLAVSLSSSGGCRFSKRMGRAYEYDIFRITDFVLSLTKKSKIFR